MTQKTMLARTRRPEPEVRRWPRRRALAGAVVAGLVLVAGLGIAFMPSPGRPGMLLAYQARCPRAPLDQVPDAQTYRVEVPCARIAGTVVAYRLNHAYDDLELTVVPGRQYRSALPAANNGRFTVDVVGPDLSSVESPDLESSGTFYGSWVENRATHAFLLMPTWRITASPGAGANPDSLLFSLAAARHSGQVFRWSTGVPATLAPGIVLTIPVTASWVVPAVGKHPAHPAPASQIRILVGITGPSGRSVVWKAAQTGTLGLVTIRLPLIVSTGRYICHLYALAGGRVVAMARSFVVGKA